MHLKTVSSGKEREISIVAKDKITASKQGMIRNYRVGLEEPNQARNCSSNGTVRKFQKFLREFVRKIRFYSAARLEKTWTDACQHFQQFANDRDEVQTASGAGFHANHVDMALAANSDALATLHSQMANLGVTNTTQAVTILDLTKTRLAAATVTHQAYRNDINCSGNGGRSGGHERHNQPQPAPASGRTPKYCWPHGSCAHLGADSRTPSEGHQAAATFANRMSGSNLHCC